MTPATLNVAVSAQEKLAALEVMSFLPNDLTINTGDSIVFAQQTAEPQTVTFNVPDPPPADFIPRYPSNAGQGYAP